MNISKETHQRLINLPVPSSVDKRAWQKIITLSNTTMLKALDEALGDGRSAHDKMIIAGVVDGPNKFVKMIGKGGKITTNSTRYVHHMLNVIDLVILARGPWDGEELFNHLHAVQRSFSKMKKEYGNKGGPLAKGHIRMARAITLADLLNIRLNSTELQFFIENHDALEPYFDLIVQRREMTGDRIKALIDTRPELALADGAL